MKRLNHNVKTKYSFQNLAKKRKDTKYKAKETKLSYKQTLTTETIILNIMHYLFLDQSIILITVRLIGKYGFRIAKTF